MPTSRLSDGALQALLEEDTPHGDLTTHSLGIGDRLGLMSFAARGSMVAAGVEDAARLCELTGCRSMLHAASGERMAADDMLLRVEGPAASLHRAWKVAQNLMEYSSGIATTARALVDAARTENPNVQVVTTRKPFPGTRALAVKAVKAGGASVHRLGLSETLLVFAEHRCFLTKEEMRTHLSQLRSLCPEKKVVAEVCDPEEAHAAVQGGVDVLQLERFSPEQVTELSAWLVEEGVDNRVILAAAGGVTLANAAEYARAGAAILVTSAPYFAKPADVRVRMKAL
ncbi:ModD protein [Rhodospirillum sp. A1_3_36]|uniref:ModD protein n=1 Tax=Rhodospirillum sp. A1_3_36 TaxID=3391666 RepID=UPI0039A4DF32